MRVLGLGLGISVSVQVYWMVYSLYGKFHAVDIVMATSLAQSQTYSKQPA